MVIEVSGGVVAEVSNLPPGYDYEIVDHDLEESTTEGWAEEDSL